MQGAGQNKVHVLSVKDGSGIRHWFVSPIFVPAPHWTGSLERDWEEVCPT